MQKIKGVEYWDDAGYHYLSCRRLDKGFLEDLLRIKTEAHSYTILWGN